jgi:hypothetical protein
MPPSLRGPYAVLGVPHDASEKAIRAAYRNLAKRVHPDVDPSPYAAQRFMEIHRAYAVLKDPLLRLACDMRMRATVSQAQRPPAYRAGVSTIRRSTVDDHKKHWTFIGLHVAGLLSGLLLVFGVSYYIVFADGPWYALLFTLPGLLMIPEAWEGLRA